MIWTFLTQSYWRDEAFRIFMAREPLLKIIQLAPFDAQPPLYYFLLHYWIKIFGDGEIATRALSLIFYELLVFLGYKFAQKILPKTKFAYIVTILMLVNPLLIYYAFEARMYMFFLFLATWSFYSFWTKKGKSWALATLLALYTHNFMLFGLLVQALWAIFHRDFFFKMRRSFLIVGLLYLPWLPVVFIQTRQVESGFWIGPLGAGGLLTFLSGLFSGYEGDPASLYPLFSLLSLSLLLVMLWAGRMRKKTGNFLLTWLLVPGAAIVLLSFVGRSVFLIRYMVFLFVPLILLIAYFIYQKNNRWKFFSLLFFLALSWYLNLLLYPVRLKVDIRKSVGTIASVVRPSDLILTSSLNYFETKYYFTKFAQDSYTRTVPVKIYDESGAVPFYVGKVLIANENVTKEIPQDRRVFWVKETGGFTLQLPVF